MQSKKLYRSREGRILAGICAGLADYFGIDPTIVRVLTVALSFFTPALLIYIICIFIIPNEPYEY